MLVNVLGIFGALNCSERITASMEFNLAVISHRDKRIYVSATASGKVEA